MAVRPGARVARARAHQVRLVEEVPADEAELDPLGRPSEARPFFEKALALNPAFAPARERLGEIAAARKPSAG